MAKKQAAEKDKHEPVTRCDNLDAMSPDHDDVITSVTQSYSEDISIKSMIRVVRGQQVMLDFDLAFLYGVETKALNQAVKRNINRFPEDFMFKLTKSELEILRSQIVTSNLDNNHGSDILMSQNATSSFAKMGLRRPPHAFNLQRCNHSRIARDNLEDVEILRQKVGKHCLCGANTIWKAFSRV